MTAAAQPSNVRHRIILVSMLMAFILYLDRICLAEIVKSASFKTDVPLSKEEIGSILSAFFLSYALFQVPTGWASDRFGARKMLTAYIVLWSLFTGLTGFMSSFAGLLAMRLLCGAAEAGAYPTCGAVIRRWMPLAARARSSALVAFGGRVGGTLAPFLTAWMVITLGHWRRPLWIDGAVGLVIAAIYWRVVRNSPEEHPDCNDAERALIGKPPVQPPIPTSEFLGMLWAFCRNRNLWLNAAGQLFTNIGWAFLITWLPTYLKEQQHVEDVAGGRMVTVVLAFGMAGQLVGGWVADLSVRRFGLRWGRVLPLFASGFLGGSAYLVCLNMNSAWGVVACCCLVSFAVDMGNPATWAFMQDIGGRATAAAFGWGNMWGNFGAAMIAKLVPWLLAIGTSGEAGQRNVFLVCAGALFLYGFLSLGLDATKPVLKTAAQKVE
ncbi:glucarate transporter [Verrucomicrobiota bacterium]|nr:glucarate transporter [Verrucomicrobiota bacterium]